ncbi:MAG: NUDIX hydrolase [Oscillospiraceae bacterium]|nr:NUDIX hydrolase [Oscillospiraceae bacterium]
MGYVEDLRALVGHRRLILCGGSVVVRNEKGQLLLQQRKHPVGRWCFPGGLMELAESTEDTARRELWEETGLQAGKLRLIGVYSGPDALCRAANGDEWYVVNVAYAADDVQGEPRVNDEESAALGWFFPEEMPETLVSSHKKILADYLQMEKNTR